MSVYVTFSEEPGDLLASNSGWGHVGDWIETLSPDEYPALFTLWDHGIYEPCSAVREELRKAVADSPPEDATVVSTLTNLAQAIDEHEDKTDPVLTTTGSVGDADE